MKKYAVLLGLLALVPACANAEISVKDTVSPEFIHNQGYSSEVSRIIDVKTKDPVTPIPAEKDSVWKKFGWEVLQTVDPSWTREGRFVDHNTRFDRPTLDDL